MTLSDFGELLSKPESRPLGNLKLDAEGHSCLTIAKPEDAVIGIKTFGESAPGDELMKEFGFTVENIISSVKKLI